MNTIRVFLSENFQFLGGEIFYIFEYACFRNDNIYMTCSTVFESEDLVKLS